MKKVLFMCAVIGLSTPLIGSVKVESKTETITSKNKATDFLYSINSENGTNYKLLDRDYITIILKLDLEEGNSGISSQGIDEVLTTSKYENMVGVKFNELNSNTYYYIRFRTVKEIGDDVSTGYEIEIAKDSSYNESRKVVIGKEISEEEGIKFKWSRSLKIKTRNEINGEIDGSLFIIDDRDYIVEENVIGTREYIFNEEDRFVSRLLSNLTNRYEIDISKDVGDIKKRVIKIPKRNIEGLVQSKIDLKIKSVGITTLLENVLLSNIVKEMVDESSLIITLEENNKIYEMINFEDRVLSRPEKITIAIGGVNSSIMEGIGNGFKIIPNIDSDVVRNNLNINFYSTEKEDGKFKIEHLNSGSNEVDGKIGNTYFLLGKNESKILTVKKEINNLNRKIKIKDIEHYYEKDLEINTTQFNNIIIGILKNDQEVNMNEKLTEKKYNFLGKSQMLVSGKYVTKEAGISSMVKLYELKNKSRIQIESEIKIPNENIIDPKYKKSITKAIEIGLINEEVDFKGNMTFKEFVSLINRIW